MSRVRAPSPAPAPSAPPITRLLRNGTHLDRRRALSEGVQGGDPVVVPGAADETGIRIRRRGGADAGEERLAAARGAAVDVVSGHRRAAVAGRGGPGEGDLALAGRVRQARWRAGRGAPLGDRLG